MTCVSYHGARTFNSGVPKVGLERRTGEWNETPACGNVAYGPRISRGAPAGGRALGESRRRQPSAATHRAQQDGSVPLDSSPSRPRFLCGKIRAPRHRAIGGPWAGASARRAHTRVYIFPQFFVVVERRASRSCRFVIYVRLVPLRRAFFSLSFSLLPSGREKKRNRGSVPLAFTRYIAPPIFQIPRHSSSAQRTRSPSIKKQLVVT